MTDYKSILKEGTVLRGENYDFTIVRAESQDGFGVNYMATGVPHVNPSGRQGQRSRKPEVQEFLIREHFMFHCSHRADDGMTVVTPEDALSTVEDFVNIFNTSVPWFIKTSKGRDSLVQIVDFFQANNTSYYATEYLKGPSLKEYIATNGPTSIAECQEIMSPVFLAVRYLHTQHMLHTDLSPDSIILTTRPDGSRRPVLTRHYGCKPFVDRAEAGWQLPPMSCPDSFAPIEQYGEMDKFLPQTNVYSLAAIIFFMLSGKEPPAPQDVTDHLIREMLPPGLPDEFVEAIVKGMAPDWHDRHVNLSDFRSVLIESLDAEARRRRESFEQANPDYKRNKILSGFLIVAAIVAAILIMAWIIYIDT